MIRIHCGHTICTDFSEQIVYVDWSSYNTNDLRNHAQINGVHVILLQRIDIITQQKRTLMLLNALAEMYVCPNCKNKKNLVSDTLTLIWYL